VVRPTAGPVARPTAGPVARPTAGPVARPTAGSAATASASASNGSSNEDDTGVLYSPDIEDSPGFLKRMVDQVKNRKYTKAVDKWNTEWDAAKDDPEERNRLIKVDKKPLKPGTTTAPVFEKATGQDELVAKALSNALEDCADKRDDPDSDRCKRAAERCLSNQYRLDDDSEYARQCNSLPAVKEYKSTHDTNRKTSELAGLKEEAAQAKAKIDRNSEIQQLKYAKKHPGAVKAYEASKVVYEKQLKDYAVDETQYKRLQTIYAEAAARGVNKQTAQTKPPTPVKPVLEKAPWMQFRERAKFGM
jgi:hypothetical protein